MFCDSTVKVPVIKENEKYCLYELGMGNAVRQSILGILLPIWVLGGTQSFAGEWKGGPIQGGDTLACGGKVVGGPNLGV